MTLKKEDLKSCLEQ